MNANIVRVGEPKRLHGVSSAYESPSLAVQKEYAVETTPLPGWPVGESWRKYFNAQLSGDPFLAGHDGTNTIHVQVFPDQCPGWLERVDLEIQRTNEHIGTIQYPDASK